MKRIAIVTGASSGMGREFVRQLADWERFEEVWVIARRTDRLEELQSGGVYDGVEDIRRETDEDLDRGMVCCIEHAIDHVEREKKGKITPETYIALNEIKKSLEGNDD